MAGLIYDFGSNNGDDLPYYLLRADRVVAVEANPTLTDAIGVRFVDEIRDGRLVVLNAVLSADSSGETVPFYIHRHDHVLSQFPKPADPSAFDVHYLPSLSPVEIVRQYGDPHYVKIDIEGYDDQVLRALFAGGVRPPFISAEIHSIDVFCTLVALGGYRHFKLLDGWSVQHRYAQVELDTAGGRVPYSFPMHSAGPFGADIRGSWLTAEQVVDEISSQRLGWKDLHATLTPDRVAEGEVALLPQAKRLARRMVRKAKMQLRRRV